MNVATDSGGSEDTEHPLVFNADRRSRRLGILLVLLLLSVLAHAVSFYILQVAYTPTVTLPPPPAEVTLLAPSSPENLALNRWLAVVDPALMTQPSNSRDPLAELSFQYTPSYAAAPPGYRPLNMTTPPAAPIAGDIFGPAPLPPLPAPSRPPAPSPPSRLDFDPAIAALTPQPLPKLAVSLRAGGTVPKPLEPSVFLVGAQAGGGAPYVFRQSSSGNTAVDEYAREYLTRLTLSAPSEGQATPWGWASFHWGMDVFR